MVFYVSPARSTASQYSETDQQRLLFEPTLGQAVRSSVNLAFSDVGTEAYLDVAEQVEKAGGKPITIEEYKNSDYFRPTIGYMSGMTDEKAKLLAKQYDSLEFDRDMQARATGGRSAAGMAAALITGTVELRNLKFGLMTFGAGAVLGTTARAGTRLKRILDARRMGAGYAAKAKLGALEGMISAAAMEPGNRYAADVLQDDYTMADSLFNVATSTLLGTAFEVAPKFVADRFARYGDKTKAMDITIQELDTAVEQLATGRKIEVGAVEKAYTGEISKNRKILNTDDIVEYVTKNIDQGFINKAIPEIPADRIGKNFDGVVRIPVEKIKYSQPVESINAQAGMTKAPIEVEVNDSGAFTVIDGNHRLKAAIERGDKTIEAVYNVVSSQPENMPMPPNAELVQMANNIKARQIESSLESYGGIDAITGRIDAENATSISGHIKQQLDPNNDTAIDAMAISRLEDYEDALMVQKHIDELEKTNAYIDELNKMEADGIIDSRDLDELVDAMGAVDVNMLQSAWEAARICLTRG